MKSDIPLYKFWADYPTRDVEYMRWYPPTLELIDPHTILDGIACGPKHMAFYLHVPFCKDICPYCPFNKFGMRDDRARQYLEGIAKEIQLVAAQQRSRGIKTIAGYFGGGTPTALATADIVSIVEQCFERFDLLPGAEVSIEANPDTVDEAKLRTLRETGINRISFGVQSFLDRHLETIGRTHSAEQALRVIEAAQRAGFDNIAIDLMYRLPGQSLADWQHDLETAVAAGVQHISTYCLFLDPGTRLYNDTLAGNVADYPTEEVEVAMYQLTQDLLTAHGYHQYTINDFALAGRDSEHHCINWQAPQGSYVGMGPGAFSFVNSEAASYIYCTIHSLQKYLESLRQDTLPVRIGKQLSRDEELTRYMVLGLKCLEVKKEPFRRIYGLELDTVFAEQLAQLREWGLIEDNAEKVWMTSKGKHYATNVLKAFYTPENRGKPQPIGVELLAGKGQSMVSVDLRPH